MFRKTAAALLATALVATAAQAHPKLASTMPAANAVVASPPKIELHFTEKLLAPMSGVDLTMTDMPGMKMRAPMKMPPLKTSVGADGMTLIATPAKPLPAGTYKLSYHVVSADTHRVAGDYTFKVQ